MARETASSRNTGAQVPDSWQKLLYGTVLALIVVSGHWVAVDVGVLHLRADTHYVYIPYCGKMPDGGVGALPESSVKTLPSGASGSIRERLDLPLQGAEDRKKP